MRHHPPVTAPPTLRDLFLARARSHPDAEALRFLPEASPGRDPTKPASITFRELEARARALAAGLATLPGGLPPAARVVILAGTRLETVLADIACVLAGLVSVPLYPSNDPESLLRRLAACDAHLVIADNPWQAKKLLDVEARLPSRPRLVLIDEVMRLASGQAVGLDELGARDQTPTLAELERRGQGRALEPEPQASDGCWTICYTPGTESQPRGVMWTHDNMVALASTVVPSLPALRPNAKDPGEVQLLAMPLAHALTRAMLWVGLVGERRRIPPPEGTKGKASEAAELHEPPWVSALARSEASVFEDAKRLKPTVVVGVPSLFERARAEVIGGLGRRGAIPAMVARWAEESATAEPSLGERMRHGLAERVVKPQLAARFGGRCRTFLTGGAPLGEAVQRFYLRFGLPLRECYGLVETAAMTHVDASTEPTVGCVGAPLPGVEQRFGDDGELFVRGPQVSPGYWRDAAGTSLVLDGDGWLATGDLARTDESGRVFITGRKRETIVLSNGKTLTPRPIEDALREEPLVSQAYVHGEQQAFATALIALDRAELGRLAQAESLDHLDFDSLSRHPIVHERVSALVQRVNRGLPPHAALKKHAILATELSTEAGTLTPTLEPRRAQIAERYRSLLDSFYAESF